MSKPYIKICCIGSVEEAKLAMSLGANALGLVANMPSGPGVISDDEIAHIAKHIPPSVASFLLTSEVDADRIVQHQQKTGVSTIQLVDKLEIGTYQDIKSALPAVKIVQVIHIADESSVEEALALDGKVDILLLDSGNPHLAVKELGGTGRTHNWEISSKIAELTKTPVLLAGGIHAGNVKEAIAKVKPFGIDLCSGVRTNGLLDSAKLHAFFKAVNG